MSTSTLPSFASWDMTRSTFTQLLDCYPTTLRESCKRQLIKTAERKHRKHPERMNYDNPVFDKQADAVVELDRWRWDTLPQTVRNRGAGTTAEAQTKDKDSNHTLKPGESYDGIFMHKDEAIKLLDWKLRRGRFRPQLGGMIKTNKPAVLRKATADAYKALVDKKPSRDSIEETFPKTSLDTLTNPLRAVGPAMASLILAVGSEGKANEIPFYSDELFLWLCVDWFPCSEKNRSNYKKAARLVRADGSGLNLKYNMHEYKQLYDEVVKLRERINSEEEKAKDEDDDGREFTATDMDRVAYVLQHLAASNFPNAEEIMKQDKESKRDAQEKKKEDEDDEEEEEILGVSKPQTGKKRKAGWDKRGKTKKVKK